MKIKHTGLALAIASTCGLWMPMAQALPITLSSEEPIETDGGVWSFNGDLALVVPTVKGYTVNTSNPLFIKLTLQGGAKFGLDTTNVSLRCKTAAGVNYTSVNVSKPNESQQAITFEVDDTLDVVMGSSCLVVFDGLNTAAGVAGLVTGGLSVTAGPILSISNRNTQTLKVVNEYQDGIQPRTDETVITLMSFKPTLKFDVGTQQANTDVFANATISVADGSTLFTAGTIASNQAAFIGYAVALTAGNETRFRATAMSATVGNMVSSISFAIGGSPIAFANNVGYLYSGDAAGCDEVLVSTVAPSAGVATLSTVGTQFSGGITFCMVIDGVQQQQEGQITLALNGTAKNALNGEPYAIDFGGPYDLYDLPKDGASYRALLIPPAAQAERAFIRITNTSTTAGEIIGTLYDTNGVVGTAAQVLGTIQPRQTFVLAATDLEGVFGTWSGRARLVIDSRIPELRVLSVLRSRSGILVNMSGEAEN